MRKYFFGLLWILILAGCGDSGPDDSGPRMLDQLFASPDQSMKELVLQDWKGRSREAPDARVIFDSLLQVESVEMRLSVIRHGDTLRHFGAVLQNPSRASAPVLVYAHGGDQGAELSEVLLLLGMAPGLAEYTIVVPSFRSEALTLNETRSWTSDGVPSPWDHDVDDLLALLAALDSLDFPGDRQQLTGLGISRGGGTILLAAIRDPRFVRVVDFFGPTDFFGDFVRSECEALWEGVPSSRPGVDALGEEIVLPLKNGLLEMDAARLALLRRSPARFVEYLPPVLVHHGSLDEVVPVAESETLWNALRRDNAVSAAQSAFLVYPKAGHNPFLMIPPFSSLNAIDSTLAFLSAAFQY